MEKEILLQTIGKIFEVLSVDLPVPTSEFLGTCSNDEFRHAYETAWNMICSAHDLCFKAEQTVGLLNALNTPKS